MSYKKDMSKYEHLEGWERCGFGEQLDKWAEKYGERTAVTDSEDEISYMELKQKADCLAAAFLRKGILKGDKVLVQLPNRISFVIVFFALSKMEHFRLWMGMKRRCFCCPAGRQGFRN